MTFLFSIFVTFFPDTDPPHSYSSSVFSYLIRPVYVTNLSLSPSSYFHHRWPPHPAQAIRLLAKIHHQEQPPHSTWAEIPCSKSPICGDILLPHLGPNSSCSGWKPSPVHMDVLITFCLGCDTFTRPAPTPHPVLIFFFPCLDSSTLLWVPVPPSNTPWLAVCQPCLLRF